MPRITLTSGFSLIPEGTYVFKVYETSYDEAFGKLKVKLITEDKQTHIENFSLIKGDGTPNEGALNSFSFMAKTIMNNFDLDDIDPEELVGHFLEAEIYHDEYNGRKYAHIGNKAVSTGWEESAEAPATGLDLDALLG